MRCLGEAVYLALKSTITLALFAVFSIAVSAGLSSGAGASDPASPAKVTEITSQTTLKDLVGIWTTVKSGTTPGDPKRACAEAHMVIDDMGKVAFRRVYGAPEGGFFFIRGMLQCDLTRLDQTCERLERSEKQHFKSSAPKMFLNVQFSGKSGRIGMCTADPAKAGKAKARCGDLLPCKVDWLIEAMAAKPKEKPRTGPAKIILIATMKSSGKPLGQTRWTIKDFTKKKVVKRLSGAKATIHLPPGKRYQIESYFAGQFNVSSFEPRPGTSHEVKFEVEGGIVEVHFKAPIKQKLVFTGPPGWVWPKSFEKHPLHYSKDGVSMIVKKPGRYVVLTKDGRELGAANAKVGDIVRLDVGKAPLAWATINRPGPR